jgi:arylsulfatase A-like enzyme
MAARPNILWLMTDEQRTDSLGCYRSPWAVSPAIDRLAAGGCVFTSAATPAPVCMPARLSLLSGRYPSETGVWFNWTRLCDEPLLTERFPAYGYRTASFGKHHHGSRHPAFETIGYFGLSEPVSYFAYADRFDESQYDVVKYPGRPYPWIFAGTYPEDESTTVERRCVTSAQEWLSEHPADTPFLLRLSFNGPHTPVVPPAPYDRLIPIDSIGIPHATEPLPDEAPRWIHDLAAMASSACLSQPMVDRMREAYYGEVAYLDSLIGELLDWMGARGMLDDTYVVFVSDHGTHLGDFGLVQKQTFYEPSVTVPYFLCGPGIPTQTVATPVETRSMLPTLMELVGIDVPAGVADASLARVVRGDGPAPDRPVFSELTLGTFEIRHDDRLVMVRSGDWKLSLCLDPAPHDRVLTNLADDPYERKNLAETEPDVAAHLEHLVHDHIAAAAG